MKEPEFRARYQEGRHLAFSQSLGRLQEASGAAVTTTLKIMLDATAPPGIRLRAAEIVLEQAAKAAELDKLGAWAAKRERKARQKANPSEVTFMNTTPLLEPPPTQPVQEVHPPDSDDGAMP